jgi:hypothetical protein
MRSFFIFLLVAFSIIILSVEKDNETKISNSTKKEKINKSENKTSNKTENKDKQKKKKPKKKAPSPNVDSSFPEEDPNGNNQHVYSLNDLTFDMVLQKGNNNKWLVILYSATCGHCEHARREIRKILPNYRNDTSIKFAEIEINNNKMTNVRFKIEGVPYIFLLQNNSMYEMNTYANQKNLKKFIETDFSKIPPEELIPFPTMVPIYEFGWMVIKNIFRGITEMVNEMLFDHGYEFEFTPLTLLCTIVFGFGSICILEYLICLKFCPDENQKKRKKPVKKEKEIIEEEKEEEDENNDETKENESDEKLKEEKEISEEEKIKREKEIEEKIKEEEKKVEEDAKNEENKNKDKKVNKKKKKE